MTDHSEIPVVNLIRLPTLILFTLERRNKTVDYPKLLQHSIQTLRLMVWLILRKRRY
jgi:hypothetical protein